MQTRCIISFTGTQASFKVGNTGCRVKLNSGGICNDQVERINWLLLHTMRWLRGGGGGREESVGKDVEVILKMLLKIGINHISSLLRNIQTYVLLYIRTYTHTHPHTPPHTCTYIIIILTRVVHTSKYLYL